MHAAPGGPNILFIALDDLNDWDRTDGWSSSGYHAEYDAPG